MKSKIGIKIIPDLTSTTKTKKQTKKSALKTICDFYLNVLLNVLDEKLLNAYREACGAKNIR